MIPKIIDCVEFSKRVFQDSKDPAEKWRQKRNNNGRSCFTEKDKEVIKKELLNISDEIKSFAENIDFNTTDFFEKTERKMITLPAWQSQSGYNLPLGKMSFFVDESEEVKTAVKFHNTTIGFKYYPFVITHAECEGKYYSFPISNSSTKVVTYHNYEFSGQSFEDCIEYFKICRDNKVNPSIKGLKDYLNERQKQVLDFLIKNSPAQLSDIIQYLPQISRATLKRDLSILVERRLLTQVGNGRGVRYFAVYHSKE